MKKQPSKYRCWICDSSNYYDRKAQKKSLPVLAKRGKKQVATICLKHYVSEGLEAGLQIVLLPTRP